MVLPKEVIPPDPHALSPKARAHPHQGVGAARAAGNFKSRMVEFWAGVTGVLEKG